MFQISAKQASTNANGDSKIISLHSYQYQRQARQVETRYLFVSEKYFQTLLTLLSHFYHPIFITFREMFRIDGNIIYVIFISRACFLVSSDLFPTRRTENFNISLIRL